MPGVAFVVNGSLVRGGGRLLALCGEAAARHGWRAEFLVTEKAEDGVTAASSAALDGIDLVVAVGGDGTVRGCAEGAGEDRGTARDRAARHRQPARADASRTRPPEGRARRRARVTQGAGGVDRTIDLAVADEVPFTAMAGMGLDAAVVAGTRLKHQFGWLAYAVSGAAHLALPPTRFSIRLDGGAPVERTARSVVVGNSGLLPGGFSLLPDARLDDGLLDVGVLAPHGPLGWPRLATRVLARSHHEDRMLERFQARKVEISATAPLPREVDGELVAAGRSLTVTVRAERLDGANAAPLAKF